MPSCLPEQTDLWPLLIFYFLLHLPIHVGDPDGTFGQWSSFDEGLASLQRLAEGPCLLGSQNDQASLIADAQHLQRLGSKGQASPNTKLSLFLVRSSPGSGGSCPLSGLQGFCRS